MPLSYTRILIQMESVEVVVDGDHTQKDQVKPIIVSDWRLYMYEIKNFSQRGSHNVLGIYKFSINAGNNSNREEKYWINFYLEVVYE